jgi:hypothetical protein
MLNISSNSSELQHRLQAFKQLLYKTSVCLLLWTVGSARLSSGTGNVRSV